MPDEVWARIQQHAGQEFRTIGNRPFTYESMGPNTIKVIRPTFTHLVGRAVLDRAYDRLPLAGPGEIADLHASSYVWAILNDNRIIHP